MPDITGLTVCVEYDDLLAVTLPLNRRHFREIVVVTRPEDIRTRARFIGERKCRLFLTDAFTRDGARFNKGLAIEEAIDAIGRNIGWICSFDADILMPLNMQLPQLDPAKLYAPWRKILSDMSRWETYTDQKEWKALPRYEETWEFAGAFLLFNTGASHLQGKRHWFGTNWRHAGGYDSDFYYTWPKEHRVRMDFDVLHLGDHGQNWFGRQTARIDDGSRSPEANERARLMRELPGRRRQEGYGWEKL